MEQASFLYSPETLELGNGLTLRLLTAREALEAKREAGELAQGERERALCSNACLLARALEHEQSGEPVFPSGQAALAGLTVEEIASLAARWSEFSRSENPGPEISREGLEKLKKN